MDSLFPPRAFIIGAHKAGTSSLAGMLAQHPLINMARGKEVHFFSANWDKGLDWYRAQFDPKPGARILLDASTSYAGAPLGPHKPPGYQVGEDRLKMPERIAALRPDARLVYVVRDPVERIYSSYWQRVRFGWENRPLEAALRESPERYVFGSLYYAQLAHYLRIFPREAILLLNFQDLKKNPAAVARTCLAFFGVASDGFEFTETRARNVGFRYNAFGRLLRTVAGSERALSAVSGTARKVLPRRIYDALSRSVSKPIDTLDAQTRKIIEPYVAEDYKRWVEFTALELV